MNLKAIALALALTVVGWAQTSSKTSPTIPEKPAAPAATASPACHQGEGKDASCCASMSGTGKEEMSCCAHHDAASEKDSMPCCHHEAKDAGQPMSCCKDKGGKSCMKDNKSANASTVVGCCPDGSCCGKEKACCDSSKDVKTTAMACCSGHSGPAGHTGTGK